MRDPSKYGRYHWCIKSPLAANGEIYAEADDVRILPDGSLILVRLTEDKSADKHINIAFAPGQWLCIFSASAFDGSAVAVSYWKGEVIDG